MTKTGVQFEIGVIAFDEILNLKVEFVGWFWLVLCQAFTFKLQIIGEKL